MEREVRKLDVEEGFASSVLHSCLFFPDGSCGDLRSTLVTSFFPAITYTFLPAWDFPLESTGCSQLD
jgi:hypothetical protein